MAIVFAVVTITFFVVHLAQGTPCGGERPLPPDVCERERAVFGYDKPLQVQYVKYLAALLHGKMGGQVFHVLQDRKSTRLNSSHSQISYAVFCLKKKKTRHSPPPPIDCPRSTHCPRSYANPRLRYSTRQLLRPRPLTLQSHRVLPSTRTHTTRYTSVKLAT